MAVAAFLAARLRNAAARIAELGVRRDRDADTIARVRTEVQSRADERVELARAQAALADAQAELAQVRMERDAASLQAAQAHLQRHSFVAGLAHDLRNPLAPLSNGLELLRLTDDDPAGRLRTRGIMERQVGNLMRMAEELSDLARLTDGHARLQDAPFDLSTLLAQLGARQRPALQAQEMTLEIDPGLADVPPLEGDAQRLEQALGHLVDDIRRHAERGSTLRIEGCRDGAAVSLHVATVADLHGAPAPLEEVDAPALGLGVALASQLVALHGGQLRARRPAGARRVRFILSLPVDTAVPVRAPGPRAAAPMPALTVLLADDNVDFAHSFGTMLELLGHHVDMVHDGMAAVDAIVGAPPDIAFIDLGMPSLDGVEAVRRVRAHAGTRAVVLVAVTGSGGAEDRARAEEAGFDRYLVKPFSMQDVRDALDASQSLRSGALHEPVAVAPSQAG